jgi:hypothetical protein
MAAPAPLSPLAVLVRSADADALRFALALGGTAVAAGEAVTLALFGEAVGRWCGALEADPRWADEVALVRQLSAAHGAPLRVLACSAAVDAAGLDPDALETRGVVTTVAGWPAIWREVRAGRVVVV